MFLMISVVINPNSHQRVPQMRLRVPRRVAGQGMEEEEEEEEATTKTLRKHS